MPFHTVEALVGQHSRSFQGVVDIPPNQTDKEAFARQSLNLRISNTLDIQPCELTPGQYYPRMARPTLINNSFIGRLGHGPFYIHGENMAKTLPHSEVALANSVNQLSIMIRELKSIMEYIHPSHQNLQSFGHQTRNVLLLAAMDFENECRGLLVEHGYSAPGNRFTTRDYVKVASPLRLDEYEVALAHYPSLGPVRPFAGWDSNSPTQSIPWYDAYNYCKHDREANFHQGNLTNAIHAVCAVAIMLAAQYRIIESWRDQIGEFFDFRSHPAWHTWQYVMPSGNGWQSLRHTF